jgi:xanthine dehydrogenase accessory factor
VDRRTRDAARQALAAGTPAVVVEVREARGSVPRAAGTRMLVLAGCSQGTIGGGHLELKAIAAARAMLDADERAAQRALSARARPSASAAAER